MRARAILVMVLLAAGLLSGCGQKGPLYREVPGDAPPVPAGPGVDGRIDDEGQPG